MVPIALGIISPQWARYLRHRRLGLSCNTGWAGLINTKRVIPCAVNGKQNLGVDDLGSSSHTYYVLGAAVYNNLFIAIWKGAHDNGIDGNVGTSSGGTSHNVSPQLPAIRRIFDHEGSAFVDRSSIPRYAAKRNPRTRRVASHNHVSVAVATYCRDMFFAPWATT